MEYQPEKVNCHQRLTETAAVYILPDIKICAKHRIRFAMILKGIVNCLLLQNWD